MRDSAVTIIATLANVLRHENRALRAMDLPAAAGLLAAKTEALAALEAMAESHPVDAAATAALGELNVLIRENRVLLERAITVQDRVIGIVVGAAASAAARPAYGSKARAPRLSAMALSTRA